MSPRIRSRLLDRLGPVGRLLRSARGRVRKALPLSKLQARIDELQKRQDEVAAMVELGDRRGAEAQRLLAELERRAQATQALASAGYERAERWAETLERLRALPDYETAYDDERPLITVRISTWNRADLLCDRALASVLRQTYDNWEAVVIGDGCTDNTEARIAALEDPRIRFENLPVRERYPDDATQMWQVAGTAAARRAFELAQGHWLAQLDDDDEWDDEHLEVLLEEARRTRSEVLYSKWRLRDAASGQLLKAELGSSPPRLGHFAFQCALEHGLFRNLPPDPLAYLFDEPGDWHRARRLIAAGARFGFLDRALATIWYAPRTDEAREWFDSFIEANGYEVPGPSEES